MSNKPGKTLKIGGHAHVTIEGDNLTITPEGGLIVVAVGDLQGNQVWLHHPLSGWYIEVDSRKEDSTEIDA